VQNRERRQEFSAAASLSDELSAEGRRSSSDAAGVASIWGSSPGDARISSPYGGPFGGSFSSEGQGIPVMAANRGQVGHRGGVLHAPMQKRVGGGLQIGEHTGFLRMRGLPFSAAKEDIVEFFRDFNPVPESVVLTYRNDGRVTGEAYIGFMSADDARRAMELNRRSMGSRYIELFISNKDEQGRALARFGDR
jgi:heterogeneous nuclear ribonucleoprotein F/H